MPCALVPSLYYQIQYEPGRVSLSQRGLSTHGIKHQYHHGTGKMLSSCLPFPECYGHGLEMPNPTPNQDLDFIEWYMTFHLRVASRGHGAVVEVKTLCVPRDERLQVSGSISRVASLCRAASHVHRDLSPDVLQWIAWLKKINPDLYPHSGRGLKICNLWRTFFAYQIVTPES